jgi:hypothetical protein
MPPRWVTVTVLAWLLLSGGVLLVLRLTMH